MTSNFISRGAEGYDAYMGRWSRRLAPLFLDFAGAGPGERVLDVGCGTGNLAFALAERADIAAIEAIDYEEQFVEALRQRNTDPRITAQFDDYWNPLLTGQGTLEEFLASLPQRTREQIQSGVRAAYLCNRPDGPRSFAGVAWAVSGIVPAG